MWFALRYQELFLDLPPNQHLKEGKAGRFFQCTTETYS